VHQNSALLFRKYALEYFSSGQQVLEIGPNTIPSTYRRIVDDDSLAWDTLDLHPRPNITYCGSEYEFPIEDGAYDFVLSGQVIEHVPRIWVWIREVARVCKEGGLVVTINPVSWPYHEAPVDCWRIYPEGMRALYEEAGLEVLLSRWESLEATDYPVHIPGRSFPKDNVTGSMAAVYRALGHAGFPVERAYDTITVGRKRPA
jgi:SAM-dependent methyltransferase